jgi:hypothetical protein
MPERIGLPSPVLALFCALTWLGGVLPVAHAQISRSDSAAFVGITRGLLDAVTSGDSGVWAPHLSPSWFMTDEEGRHITRSEFLRDLHPLPRGQTGRLQLIDWHLVGTSAAAVMSYAIDEEHNYYGQPLRTRFRATDTWVRDGEAWRMLASQVTALPTPVRGHRLRQRLLDEYVGTYLLTADIELRVESDTAGLSLVRASRPAERLYALDERLFIRHGVRGFWVFERDSAGAVTRLVNWRDNNAVIWRRRPPS